MRSIVFLYIISY
jgi:hypothetical protein